MRSLMSRKAARTIYRTLLVVASFDDYYIWYMLVGILLRDVWRRAVDVSEVLGYVATSTRVDGCVDDTTWPCVTKQKPAKAFRLKILPFLSPFLSIVRTETNPVGFAVGSGIGKSPYGKACPACDRCVADIWWLGRRRIGRLWPLRMPTKKAHNISAKQTVSSSARPAPPRPTI